MIKLARKPYRLRREALQSEFIILLLNKSPPEFLHGDAI